MKSETYQRLAEYFNFISEGETSIDEIRSKIKAQEDFNMKIVFSMTDSDNKNYVTLLDLRNLLNSAQYDDEMLRKLVHLYDKNNDFALDYHEYSKLFEVSSEIADSYSMPDGEIQINEETYNLVISLILTELDLLKSASSLSNEIKKSSDFTTYEAFIAIDTNAKRYFDASDIANYMQSFGYSSLNSDKVLWRLDKDGDNKISYEEFQEIFAPCLSYSAFNFSNKSLSNNQTFNVNSHKKENADDNQHFNETNSPQYPSSNESPQDENQGNPKEEEIQNATKKEVERELPYNSRTQTNEYDNNSSPKYGREQIKFSEKYSQEKKNDLNNFEDTRNLKDATASIINQYQPLNSNSNDDIYQIKTHFKYGSDCLLENSPHRKVNSKKDDSEHKKGTPSFNNSAQYLNQSIKSSSNNFKATSSYQKESYESTYKQDHKPLLINQTKTDQSTINREADQFNTKNQYQASKTHFDYSLLNYNQFQQQLPSQPQSQNYQGFEKLNLGGLANNYSKNDYNPKQNHSSYQLERVASPSRNVYQKNEGYKASFTSSTYKEFDLIKQYSPKRALDYKINSPKKDFNDTLSSGIFSSTAPRNYHRVHYSPTRVASPVRYNGIQTSTQFNRSTNLPRDYTMNRNIKSSNLSHFLSNLANIENSIEKVKQELSMRCELTLDELFGLFDLKRRGQISLIDLKDGLISLNIFVNIDDVKEIFKKYDRDIDGYLK